MCYFRIWLNQSFKALNYSKIQISPNYSGAPSWIWLQVFQLCKFVACSWCEVDGNADDGNTRVTPPSLSSQPLWVMCPATPEASPTWPRWTPTCLLMSAPRCASLPACCRLFHSVQGCDAVWSTSPRCVPCNLLAPGCCTAPARLPEIWCSKCWQKRSRTSGCSATLQVRNCPSSPTSQAETEAELEKLNELL